MNINTSAERRELPPELLGLSEEEKEHYLRFGVLKKSPVIIVPPGKKYFDSGEYFSSGGAEEVLANSPILEPRGVINLKLN